MRAPGRQFADPETGDERSSIDRLLAEGSPVVVVFADEGCAESAALEARLRGLLPRLRGRVTVRILHDGMLARAYGVPALPAAAAVNTVGRMSHGPVAGAQAVEDLVRLVAGLESVAQARCGVAHLQDVPAYVGDTALRP